MNSPKIRGEKVLVQKYDLHIKSGDIQLERPVGKKREVGKFGDGKSDVRKFSNFILSNFVSNFSFLPTAFSNHMYLVKSVIKVLSGNYYVR